MAVGEWRQIPNSAMSTAPISVQTYPALGGTGPESKVIAWCGLAMDTRDSTLYSPANGGHMDYAGNEVDSIRLSDDAPRWVERRASTPVSLVRTSTTHYGDGRPTSRHSYYGLVCNELRNRVMVMAGSRWGDGWQMAAMDGFDLSANDWDAARTYPDVPAAVPSLYGATIVEQKSTGDIYAFANNSVFRWGNDTNKWTTVATGGIVGFEAGSALDTQRNRILVLGGLGNDRGLYTLGSNTTQSVSLSGSAAGSVSGAGNGMVYEPLLDAYLLRKSGPGSTVYRIDAQTFAVDVLATTGGGSVPSAYNDVYRRFLFAPTLGGVVYCPDYDTNLWFLRTT
jgi:hypothetical protein